MIAPQITLVELMDPILKKQPNADKAARALARVLEKYPEIKRDLAEGAYMAALRTRVSERQAQLRTLTIRRLGRLPTACARDPETAAAAYDSLWSRSYYGQRWGSYTRPTAVARIAQLRAGARGLEGAARLLEELNSRLPPGDDEITYEEAIDEETLKAIIRQREIEEPRDLVPDDHPLLEGTVDPKTP